MQFIIEINLVILIVSVFTRLMFLVLNPHERVATFFRKTALINLVIEFFFNLLALCVLISCCTLVSSVFALSSEFQYILYLSVVSVIVHFYSYFFYYTIDTYLNKKKEITELFSEANLVNRNISVYEYDDKEFNAYSTGVFSNTRQILFSKKLYELLNKEERYGIIMHEVAHFQHHDLLKRYMLQVGLTIVFAFCMYSANQSDIIDEYLLTAIMGGLYGGLNVTLVGLISKKQEHVADLFSLHSTGKPYVIDALKRMNTATQGLLNKKSLSYPTLDERIQFIKKHSRT
ncbi:M48 family metallopeptidase [Sphingobacterium paludis]|uniref:Zn-dependent protease with chaperone function n=1 Tax=Sphingobacterium paludis TaxID=1476465 RepID=A0A4R7D4I7_9SPHI|nr:M48 family metallopeptidase [Sphingobacterium paludis]TDS14564.1 Zn-dependent protease with chaperone function [Sphingobacterium paludis]